MKKTIIFALTLLLLMGCRHHRAVSPRLVELDSLIAVAPDSAAALLAAIPADSLTDPENRAYHALLLTQAKYKAYIPATSDSDINIAVDYFVAKNDGNYDHRIRSLIYKGCVMTELNQPDSAMYWFKSAETAAHPDDHANLGYINYWMGRVYQSQNSDVTCTINKYRASVSHYALCNDSSRLLLSLMEIGGVFRNENNDSAFKYINWAKRFALELKDTLHYYACLNAEAYAHYLNGDYSKAKKLVLSILNANVGQTDSARAMMLAAMSLAKLGQTDSANLFCKKLPLPEDSASQVLYYDMCAQVCQARQDQLGYLKNIRQSESIAGDILSRSLQQKLIDIEKDSQLHIAEADSKLAQQHSRFIAILAIVLFLLVGIAFAFWQKRKKLEAVSKQNEINKLYLELKEISQRSESLSQQNKELSQENEELQALAKKVQQTESDLSAQKDRMDKDYADLENERLKEKQLSKSLEYIAGLLHTFIQQSHELKPSEFMEKFRKGFLETPNGGEVDFWYTLRVQADQVHGGAVERLLAEHPDLNETFIRVLCMSALGFSTEMMATCLQHKSDYIKTLKNRLKKKLDINCSIPDYLKQLGETR